MIPLFKLTISILKKSPSEFLFLDFSDPSEIPTSNSRNHHGISSFPGFWTGDPKTLGTYTVKALYSRVQKLILRAVFWIFSA